MIGYYINNGWVPFCSQWWGEIFSIPYDLFRELRAFYQRGMYGYADCDLWSLDDYLAEWIPSALADLKETPVDHAASGMDLDLMIDGFRATLEVDDVFINGRPFDEYLAEIQTFEDRRLKGMNHFVEHFNGLWW